MFVVLGGEMSQGMEICCVVIVNCVRCETDGLDDSVVCGLCDRV